ncbi:MAG TPA: hypothetical protein VFG31_02185, partial [Conexibacter sp.]|nr:hypothetical protein [Conexibacter sp.]
MSKASRFIEPIPSHPCIGWHEAHHRASNLCFACDIGELRVKVALDTAAHNRKGPRSDALTTRRRGFNAAIEALDVAAQARKSLLRRERTGPSDAPQRVAH